MGPGPEYGSRLLHGGGKPYDSPRPAKASSIRNMAAFLDRARLHAPLAFAGLLLIMGCAGRLTLALLDTANEPLKVIDAVVLKMTKMLSA